MKKTILYAAMILALGFAASCDKAEEGFAGEGLIRFAPKTVETKAMVNDASELQGMTFKVFDQWSGQTALYIDDEIKFGNGAWNYTSGNKYTWKKGTHKLFGYRSDNVTTSFADNAVTFTHTFTTAAATQVDLLYSEVISMTDTEWKSIEGNTKETPIPLHFKHLATGLSMTLENYTAEAVTVSAVSVSLPNEGSATVSFAGTEPLVTPGTLTKGTFTAGTLASTTLASKAKLDVLAQASLAADAKAAQYMVWPQTFAAGDVTVTVSYTQGGVAKEKTVSIPAATWESGKIYAYNLEIRPTELTITFHVEDWQVVELDDIETATASINMSNVMWVNKKVNFGTETAPVYKNTVDNDGYGTVYLLKKPDNTYEPAVGFFTVNYPTSGTYEISLIPAYGGTEADLAYFEITNNRTGEAEEVITGKALELPHSGNAPETIYFSVRAKDPGTAKHVAQINIHITPTDGVRTSAYSEIRATYTLTINNDPE